MKKNKHLCITTTFIFLCCFTFNQLEAQETFVASSGSLTSSDGSVHYTLGQVNQNFLSSADGSILQGIQFSFESISLSITDLELNTAVSTYPNPTSNYLNITLDKMNSDNLSFALYDLSGQLIKSAKIKNNSTSINIEELPSATYVLTISDSKTSLKSFKIIKN